MVAVLSVAARGPPSRDRNRGYWAIGIEDDAHQGREAEPVASVAGVGGLPAVGGAPSSVTVTGEVSTGGLSSTYTRWA